jgi:hypothetical protein
VGGERLDVGSVAGEDRPDGLSESVDRGAGSGVG